MLCFTSPKGPHLVQSGTLGLRHRRPPTGVSPKVGVSDGVSGGVSPGPFGPRAPECPKTVPRVSPEYQKVSRTLRGHSRDTFWTPPPTLRRTPRFSGTLRQTLQESLGPFARETPVGGRRCLNARFRIPPAPYRMGPGRHFRRLLGKSGPEARETPAFFGPKTAFLVDF